MLSNLFHDAQMVSNPRSSTPFQALKDGLIVPKQIIANGEGFNIYSRTIYHPEPITVYQTYYESIQVLPFSTWLPFVQLNLQSRYRSRKTKKDCIV